MVVTSSDGGHGCEGVNELVAVDVTHIVSKTVFSPERETERVHKQGASESIVFLGVLNVLWSGEGRLEDWLLRFVGEPLLAGGEGSGSLGRQRDILGCFCKSAIK